MRVWAHHGLMDDHEGGEDGGAAARQGSVQPLAVDDIHEDAAPEHGAENGAEAKEVEAGSDLAAVVARLVVVAPGKFSAWVSRLEAVARGGLKVEVEVRVRGGWVRVWQGKGVERTTRRRVRRR